jgi:hypothetical protein
MQPSTGHGPRASGGEGNEEVLGTTIYSRTLD